jgi:hypothetical protein
LTRVCVSATFHPQLEEEPVLHRIGVTQDSPFQNIALAGVMFQRQTQKVEVNKATGETVRTEIHGAIVELSGDQRAQIIAWAKNRVIRHKPTPSIYLKGSRRYAFMPGDEDGEQGRKGVLHYIFMEPIKDSESPFVQPRPTTLGDLEDAAAAEKAKKPEPKPKKSAE